MKAEEVGDEIHHCEEIAAGRRPWEGVVEG
jgi:hypothetical protein